jgi:hypothetical protein
MYQAGINKHKKAASQGQRSEPKLKVKIKASGHSAHRLLKKLGQMQSGGTFAGGQ